MMNAKTLLTICAGILFALGMAFIGWQAGLGVYATIYESMRDSGREVAIDSKRTLDIFRTSGWVLALALGAFLFWRWRRAGELTSTGPAVKRFTALALIGAGAVNLGYALMHGVSVEAMVSIAFLCLIAGSALAAAFFGTAPLKSFAGRFAVAAGLCFALLWVCLAFDKGISRRYDSVEQKRDVWVRIRFPEGTKDFPTNEQIKVEMRTPAQTVKGFAIAWEDKDTRPYLPVNFSYTEMTNDRALVVTLPDRAPIVIKLPFSRNPPPSYNYSGWIDLGGGLSYRYSVR